MKSALTLSLLLCAVALPALALTDQTSHYDTPQAAAPLTDPDEKDNFSSSGDSSPGLSGREQSLLGGMNNGQQTYGFGSPGGSLNYGFGQGSVYSPGFQTR